MTCVIGLVHEGKVYMGADSMSANSESFYAETSIYPKITRVKGFLIGYTSSWRMGQLLAHKLILPNVGELNLMSYMATLFVESVHKCFEDGRWLTVNDEKASGGTFLVATKGRLFRVQEDFSVLETDCGYDAIGCAADVAKGAMFASTEKDPEKRITLSLEASEKFSAGVRNPFYIESI